MSHPSDNLYSANDEEDDNQFDRQSFSDELSPSDGYFRGGSGMPPNTMVADPSLDRKERVEDKTLIPPPNVQQRAGQSSRTSMHPLLSRSPPSQSYASQPASSQSPKFFWMILMICWHRILQIFDKGYILEHEQLINKYIETSSFFRFVGSCIT